MAARSSRLQHLLDLWAAHRELTAIEWLEFQQSILSAVAWLACAALGGFSGWLAVNVAVVIAFRQDPVRAVCAVAGVNLVGALIAGLQVRRLLSRPFFALTKREAARDASTLLKVIS